MTWIRPIGVTLGRLLAIAALTAAFFVPCAYWNIALPKDNGQWEAVPQEIRTWFKSLKNKQGQICCNESDAHQIADDEWKIDDRGTVLVKFENRWFEVPHDKIVNVPNLLGVALLFISPQGNIYCFVPTPLG